MLHFDVLDVEMGDLDVFESVTGKRFDEFDWKHPGGATDMKAIYYLVMRQNDPDFTTEKLGKVKLRQLMEVAEAMKGMAVNPTPGGDES